MRHFGTFLDFTLLLTWGLVVMRTMGVIECAWFLPWIPLIIGLVVTIRKKIRQMRIEGGEEDE